MKTTYLNHAGTSWPKPDSVVSATNAVLVSDPRDWSREFAAAHQSVADFFHVDRSRLLLTPSCTAALQLAIQDHPWQAGDRLLTSHFEHHALLRAAHKLEEQGVEVQMLPYNSEHLIDLEALEAELTRGSVRLVAMTAACNVTGKLLPFEEAISIAHRFNCLALIDGAQIAGWWNLDVDQLGADLFTFAGHKGPQAPWGIGGLYVRPQVSMTCPSASCSVTDQLTENSQHVMPGYCDAGSVNLAALAGLQAACQWLSGAEQEDRLQRARSLAEMFSNAICRFPSVTIYHNDPMELKVPTVAINIVGMSAAEVGRHLRDNGIMVSAGFQCSPEAHRALGSEKSGVVRFSFGHSNTEADVEQAVHAIMNLDSSS